MKKIEKLYIDDRLYQLSGKTGNDEIDIVDKINEIIRSLNIVNEYVKIKKQK